LFDGDRVTGVRTDDKGVDKEASEIQLRAGLRSQCEVVILAEGPRGR